MLVCAVMELVLWMSAGFTLFLNDFSVLPSSKRLFKKNTFF